MIHQIKKLRLSAVLFVLMTGYTLGAPASQLSRTQGMAFGIGAGVKFVNLKNIAQRNITAVPPGGRAEGFAHASTPTISLYARKYFVLGMPMYGEFEFDWLVDLRKRSIYTSLSPLSLGALDTGYRYKERWDARAMWGLQLLCGSQIDVWGKLGVNLNYFDYEGIANEGQQFRTHFRLNNNFAVSPAGGLEVRYVHALSSNRSIDYILSWTAIYRNAFRVSGTTPTGNAYDIATSSGFGNTFGIKVMYRM